jgi:hypothetical protein
LPRLPPEGGGNGDSRQNDSETQGDFGDSLHNMACDLS